MQYRTRKFPWVLIGVGAALALCALVMLSQTRGVLQYCVLAPQPTEKGENILELEKAARGASADLKDVIAWTALGGACGKAALTTQNAGETVNLIAMGEHWLEVYPRYLRKGRFITETELSEGAAVMMLDDGLAFKLFGTELPEDATVSLNNVRYRVVGTVRHGGSLFGGRGVGDELEYDAYLPLTTAARKGVALETLTLSGLPLDNSGAEVIFRQRAELWSAGGQLINLSKEALRRTILPRMVLLIVGAYALIGLFKRMGRLAEGWIGAWREALRGQYLAALLPRLAGLVAKILLGYGALIGACYLLLRFSAQPLYVFTEWIPDNFVEWSSLKRVFWSLTAQAATPLRLATRELRVVEFWGGVLRWGMTLGLVGFALRGKKTAPAPE